MTGSVAVVLNKYTYNTKFTLASLTLLLLVETAIELLNLMKLSFCIKLFSFVYLDKCGEVSVQLILWLNVA